MPTKQHVCLTGHKTNTTAFFIRKGIEVQNQEERGKRDTKCWCDNIHSEAIATIPACSAFQNINPLPDLLKMQQQN